MRIVKALSVLVFSVISGCNTVGVKEGPASIENSVSVTAGNELLAEVEVVEGKVARVTPVKEVVNPDKTVVFEFSDMGNGMMLSVKNPFSMPLKYHINMVDYSGNLHKTSSCPVMAGGSVFESWPHPIPKLVVSDFQFLGDSDQHTCTY